MKTLESITNEMKRLFSLNDYKGLKALLPKAKKLYKEKVIEFGNYNHDEVYNYRCLVVEIKYRIKLTK